MAALPDDASRKVEILEKKLREFRREFDRLVEKIFYELDEGVSDLRQELARTVAQQPTVQLPSTPAIPSFAQPAPAQIQAPSPATTPTGPRPTLELVLLSTLAKKTTPVPSSELHKASFAIGRKKAGSDKALANLRIGGFATCVKRRWTITEAGRAQEQMLQRIFEEKKTEKETAPEDSSDAAPFADVAQR